MCSATGGSYKPTAKNRTLLRKYKKGVSIGFTARSSLKSKGLLPRTAKKYRGLYVIGPKYSTSGKNEVLTKNRTRRNSRRN